MSKYSIRPIAFRPEWVEEIGDIHTVIYFQQIFYWSDKGGLEDGWIFKTIKEFEYETTLTVDQQKRCRDSLVRNGWIEIKKVKAKFGKSLGSPVIHFRVLKIPFTGNPQMETRETHKTSITKSTTKSICKSAKADVAETSFSQREYMQSMRDSKASHLHLIAWYFEEKNLVFPDKPAIQKQIKRWAADAAFIVKYGNESAAKCAEYVQKKFPEDWNLSTMAKYIPQIN